ncbi:MAG: helix-turn-helix transcriptional regulator [Parachlamydiaceae bacterium]
MEEILSKKDRERIRLGFGERVRKMRQKLDVSQEELAFRSGLHRTYVGSVERGERNLSLENIFVFAKALKCDPKDLLFDIPATPLKTR